MTTRPEFLTALEAAIRDRDIPVRRYEVEPGLEDLELQLDATVCRLRIVRTGPR